MEQDVCARLANQEQLRLGCLWEFLAQVVPRQIVFRWLLFQESVHVPNALWGMQYSWGGIVRPAHRWCFNVYNVALLLFARHAIHQIVIGWTHQTSAKLAPLQVAPLVPASAPAVFAILLAITFSLALHAPNAPLLSVSTAQVSQHAKPVTHPITFISIPPPLHVRLVHWLDAPFVLLSLHASSAIPPPIIYSIPWHNSANHALYKTVPLAPLWLNALSAQEPTFSSTPAEFVSFVLWQTVPLAPLWLNALSAQEPTFSSTPVGFVSFVL